MVIKPGPFKKGSYPVSKKTPPVDISIYVYIYYKYILGAGKNTRIFAVWMGAESKTLGTFDSNKSIVVSNGLSESHGNTIFGKTMTNSLYAATSRTTT